MPADDLTPPTGPDDHVLGPDGAPLELVMYADFECPYCLAAQGIVRRVRERLEGRLRFVFRHLPIPDRHPHALQAAEAAEAAAAQGAFWPYHDALYANARRLETPDLVRRARDLGLDAERFAEELAGGVHAERVARDAESARASGATGTPAFFANGRRIGTAFDARSLVEALEEDG